MLIGYLAVWGGYCTAIWVHSSKVEHLTVNQVVAGSSPAGGVGSSEGVFSTVPGD